MASNKKKDEEEVLIEPSKPFLFARGLKCSQTSKNFLSDVAKLKGEFAKLTTAKHDIRPMENEVEMENLCNKHGVGLFAFATENQKRPNNIVFGRQFDKKMLDMVEVGVTYYESMADCQRRANTTAASSYWAPLLFFRGEEFGNAQEGSELETLHSLLIDMFHGGNKAVRTLDLEAIDLALMFTSLPGGNKVEMRGYRIAFEKSQENQSAPKVVLLEHGPNCDFELRRFRAAAPNLAKLARKQPKLPGDGNTKNVSSDPLRGLVGQLHMHKQDTSKLVTRSRFSKVLKRKSGQPDSEERAADQKTKKRTLSPKKESSVKKKSKKN